MQASRHKQECWRRLGGRYVGRHIGRWIDKKLKRAQQSSYRLTTLKEVVRGGGAIPITFYYQQDRLENRRNFFAESCWKEFRFFTNFFSHFSNQNIFKTTWTGATKLLLHLMPIYTKLVCLSPTDYSALALILREDYQTNAFPGGQALV